MIAPLTPDDRTDHVVEACEIPYPYRAMLAICSDLDETPSPQTYFLTSQYLNSNESTQFGDGLGLEIGNTIYFYMEKSEFSYWNATDDERAKVRALIQSGHIDAIHSFGDTATRRADAAETLEHLDAHNCKIRVWIDHAIAPTNLGADIMLGQGDVVGSDAYHADLSIQYGIQYVWRGRVSSAHGQDARPQSIGMWRSRDPIRSIPTMGKEVTKRILAFLGSSKYSMHASNDLARPIELRDGQATTEFMRTNSHPAGISTGDNAAGLADALSSEFLDAICARSAKAIVYTHLGKEIDPENGFPDATRAALEGLAERQRSGEILVSTTERLLDYRTMRSEVSWSTKLVNDGIRIDITAPSDGVPLDGLSFRVAASLPCELYCAGVAVKSQRTDTQDAGYSVVSVPWQQLDYPSI